MQRSLHPPSPFPSRQCAICGQPLTVHQAVSGGTCDRHHCRHQASVNAIAARKAEAGARLMAKVTRRRDRTAAGLKLAAPHALAIALVPASTRGMALLPAARRGLFREHLETVLTRLAQTATPSGVAQPPDERAVETPFTNEPPAVGAACSTCRGYCCHGGGVKAYIDDETLQRFAQANPSLDRNEIMHAYVGHLPKRSVKDSCVFHGEQGCALPRDMRSATCNHYHCDGLQNLQRVEAAQVLITAATEVDVVRCTVFTQEHVAATGRPACPRASPPQKHRP
jgi:hypothetical protein